MLLDRIEKLLPSSRPKWANMPSIAATPFTDLLLFTCSALDHLGFEYIVHYGSLLGAARMGSPLPWDEDHDVYVVNADLNLLRTKLEPVIKAHGYQVVLDRRGFLWIKDRLWAAGSGHVGLELLPPMMHRREELPVWEGGAPHILQEEMWPRTALPFYGSFIWGPAAVEQILTRLYGESGSVRTMARFDSPPIDPAVAEFWARVRTPDRLDWEAISQRFKSRSWWRPLLAVPWWWFNGGYIVGINALKKWARRHRAKIKTRTS